MPRRRTFSGGSVLKLGANRQSFMSAGHKGAGGVGPPIGLFGGGGGPPPGGPPSPWVETFADASWAPGSLGWVYNPPAPNPWAAPTNIEIVGDGVTPTIFWQAQPNAIFNDPGLAGFNCDSEVEHTITMVTASARGTAQAVVQGDNGFQFAAEAQVGPPGSNPNLIIRDLQTQAIVASGTSLDSGAEGVRLKVLGDGASRTLSLWYKFGGVWKDSGLSHVDVRAVTGLQPRFNLAILSQATIAGSSDKVNVSQWRGNNDGSF